MVRVAHHLRSLASGKTLTEPSECVNPWLAQLNPNQLFLAIAFFTRSRISVNISNSGRSPRISWTP